MLEKQITIKSLSNAHELVKKASSVSGDITIKSKYMEIDAKSIMGIFTIDLLNPVIIYYPKEEIIFDKWLNEKYH